MLLRTGADWLTAFLAATRLSLVQEARADGTLRRADTAGAPVVSGAQGHTGPVKRAGGPVQRAGVDCGGGGVAGKGGSGSVGCVRLREGVRVCRGGAGLLIGRVAVRVVDPVQVFFIGVGSPVS